MDAREQRLAGRDRAERVRQVRGLLILAALVLLFVIWRAGVHRVFGVGWWRFW